MTIHELFPYLRIKDAGAAIEFYKQAFGVNEKFRLTEPSGRIGHCELVFGGMLWPLAWLWAYTRPVIHKMAYGTDKVPHGGGDDALHPLEDAKPDIVSKES